MANASQLRIHIGAVIMILGQCSTASFPFGNEHFHRNDNGGHRLYTLGIFTYGYNWDKVFPALTSTNDFEQSEAIQGISTIPYNIKSNK